MLDLELIFFIRKNGDYIKPCFLVYFVFFQKMARSGDEQPDFLLIHRLFWTQESICASGFYFYYNNLIFSLCDDVYFGF